MARRRRSDPRYFPGVGDLDRSLRACGEEKPICEKMFDEENGG